MAPTSPRCHLYSTSGDYTVPNPSELQAWQYRSQSFGESPQKSWGAGHANQFFPPLGEAESWEVLLILWHYTRSRNSGISLLASMSLVLCSPRVQETFN